MKKAFSLGQNQLLALLSLIAGSLDVISFLGLNGLFISHITGNIVILAVRIVNAGEAPLALILSVPVFIFMLGLTKFFVSALEKIQYDSLRPLLFLQFIFVLGFLILSVVTDAHANPNKTMAILAGMLGVMAMAVQNALVQLSLKGSPATAVMTTNVTRFVLDMGEIWLGKNLTSITEARKRTKALWPTIVGFISGCALGAYCEAKFGLEALILPTSFALLALMIKPSYVEIHKK
jgi:uncharacterized membrane protein YoaK (UPF0700 family)